MLLAAAIGFVVSIAAVVVNHGGLRIASIVVVVLFAIVTIFRAGGQSLDRRGDQTGLPLAARANVLQGIVALVALALLIYGSVS